MPQREQFCHKQARPHGCRVLEVQTKGGHSNEFPLKKKKRKERTKSGKGKATVDIATGGEEFTFTTTFSGAMLATLSPELRPMSMTQACPLTCQLHMTCSPAITQNPLKPADQTLFVTTAMGGLWVSILNGKSTMAITLKGVLYCLDLAFTLISLMQCDMVGYSSLL